MTSQQLAFGNARPASDKARWLSANPDRAWGEKFFLFYSPVWMASMGLMMLMGWDKSFSNIALLIHAVTIAAPLLLLPLMLHPKCSPLAWHQTYWFKANLFMAIFSVFGNYVGSEYFFDVLGMVYNYPNASTTLDTALVGEGNQTVPLIMYFYTHAYFMTYHTTAVLVMRRVLTSSLPLRHLLFLPLAFAVGYCWAWMETKAMANPLMATSFYYTKLDAMLTYGSLIYATYFVVGFPIFYFLDENKAQPWSKLTVCAAALSTSMLVFYLLDICAHWVNAL
ncbi:hypothetical protein [Ketobacter alkanivorans]|uniref:Cycloeucalenol cycloisomerase n=1 Tax=Ketobacter alkanivorans TaxID=1917421 RepID=A0A2K9LJ17_9GAMM|nr:hypothetical protein [Ketobacter alkanivorans]AUM12240.1 hypothetical protein Kalk_07370 [Ketobacter alkanivorans]